MPKVKQWVPGTGTPAMCRHGAPDDAICSVNGDGTCFVNASGDCGNAYGIPPDGKAICNAVVEIYFTSGLAFQGGQIHHIQGLANPSKEESGPLQNTKIKFTIDKVGQPSFEVTFDITASGDEFSANPSDKSASVSTTSSPMDISGQHLKGYGFVSVQSTANNCARKAHSIAKTTIGSCNLSIDNGGMHDGCCNGQAPEHGPHSSQDLGQEENCGAS